MNHPAPHPAATPTIPANFDALADDLQTALDRKRTRAARPAFRSGTASAAIHRFGATRAEAVDGIPAADVGYTAHVGVMRFGDQNLAQLQILLNGFTRAEVAVRLAPEQLRELAQRLMDAANDIEESPASGSAGAAS